MEKFIFEILTGDFCEKGSLQLSLKNGEKNASPSDIKKILTQPNTPLFEALQFLRKEADINGAHFLLQGRSSVKALEYLAAFGELYYKGKRLSCDLYGGVNFLFEINSGVNGLIETTSTDFPITECDAIGAGPPHWMIKGISLRVIKSDVSWLHLKRCFKDEEPFPLNEVEEYVKDAKQDPEAPRVRILQEFQPVEPLPVLQLSDPSGAFATLLMDTGELRKFTPYQTASNAEKQWESDLLETDFVRKQVGNSDYFCPLDKVKKSLTFLVELGWKVMDCKNRQVLTPKNAQLEIGEQGNFIQSTIRITYEGYEAPTEEVYGAFNKRDSFISLAPGFVGLFPERDGHSHIYDALEEGELVSDSIRIPRYKIGSFLENKVCWSGQLKQLQQAGHLEVEHLPSSCFHGVLRPYQQKGVNWLHFLYAYGFHGLLADDMGLGKTVQVLAFLSTLKSAKKTLIVAPTSLLFNWQEEIKRFLPDFSTCLYHGPSREMDEDAEIVITSYAIARDDLMIRQTTWECCFLDEAQAIKNAESKTAQALCEIESKLRVSITGTPVENHLGELWSHFHFLMPGFLAERKEFSALESDRRYLRKIQRQIAPFILRRRKEEVLDDLPDRIEQTVVVSMDDEQQKVYDRFLQNTQKRVALDGISKHRMEVLKTILRLRQVCCHPQLVQEEGTSPKLEALLEDVEAICQEGKKVIVYSQFTSMLKVIAKRLHRHFVVLTGETSNRQEVVHRFQNAPEIQIFLVSLKAGGSGLNLTAADYILLFDPWWNIAVEEQAISRAHRIGRKECVIAKRYIMGDSIEMKIMQLKERKKAISTELLSGESLSDTVLSMDDLEFLITGL